MATKASSKGQPSQSQKFKDAARVTGCDEDEAAFDKRLRKIAKAKPSEQPKHEKKR